MNQNGVQNLAKSLDVRQDLCAHYPPVLESMFAADQLLLSSQILIISIFNDHAT